MVLQQRCFTKRTSLTAFHVSVMATPSNKLTPHGMDYTSLLRRLETQVTQEVFLLYC